jgi:hypothetical protein
MNDDITALGVVVAIVVRVVFMPVVLLRRSWSGDGERQRRHPEGRPGQKNIPEWHKTNSFSLVSPLSFKIEFSSFFYGLVPRGGAQDQAMDQERPDGVS